MTHPPPSSFETSDAFVTRHGPVLSVLVAVIVLVGAVVIETGGGTRSWIDVPLHSAMEAVGGMIALGLMVLLRLRRRIVGDDAPHYLWISASLAVMGVFDLAHACSNVGPAFSWARGLSTLLGGLLAACVWIPVADHRSPHRGAGGGVQRLPMMVALLALPFAAALLVAPDRWPPAFGADLRYVTWARVLNVAGGAGYLAAAAFLLRRARTGEPGERGASRLYAGGGEASVFAAQYLLLGLAGLLVWLSRIWSPVFWLDHVVRLSGFAVALGAAFRVYRGIEETQRGHLERELAAQMAELDAIRMEVLRGVHASAPRADVGEDR